MTTIRNQTVATGLERDLNQNDWDNPMVVTGTPNTVPSYDAAGNVVDVPLSSLKGNPGTNGGVGSSAGFASLFVAAPGMAVDTGITKIKTSGWTVDGVGGADYIYDAAVDSTTVTANPLTQFLAANGRGFKLDPTQRLTEEMFGDTSTAAGASAAFRAAADYRAYSAAIKYGTKVFLDPAGTTLSETLEPNGVFNFEGVSSLSRNPGSAGQLPSTITGPIDQTTIRFRTSGTEGLALSSGKNSSAGSLLQGVTITQPTGTDYQAHGIHIRSTVTLRNVVMLNIAGDGINISAKSAGGDGATLGNANMWYLDHVSVHTARGNGLTVGRLNGVSTAADVNAGLALGLHIHTVGRCGILDRAVYSNTYIAPLVNAAGNGGVWHLGFDWVLLTDQNIGSEPGADLNIWYKVRSSAAASTKYPQWLIGDTYYSQIYINATNSVIVTPYAENQNAYSHNPMGIVIGGNMDWTQFTAHLKNNGDGLTCNRAMGHARNTSSITHPAYEFIGFEESTLLGKPAAGIADLHKRASLFSHICADNQHHWNYENVVGGVERDIVARPTAPSSGGRRIWSITGKGTSRSYGRTTPVEHMWTMHDFGLFDATNANNHRIYGLRSVVPTTFDQAVGEYYFNTNPAAGLIGWVCKVAGTATTTGTFGKDYLNERSDPTVGIGYVTLAGGAVTQATSKATAVTLAKVCGAITMDAASLAANTAVSFTLTNSTIAATDVVNVAIKSGATAGAYVVMVDATAAGSCRISVRNMTAGALAEAIVLNFAVIKAVAA